MLDRAVDPSCAVSEKSKWFKTAKGTFQNFIRTAAFVAVIRAHKSIARLVLNIRAIPHKPQSKNQQKTLQTKNEKKMAELEGKNSVIVNCWCEVYVDQKWIPVAIRANKLDAVFYRTYPLLSHQFGNVVIVWSGNLYSLGSPGNQYYPVLIIYSLICSSTKVEIGEQSSIIKNI